jgi:hypothetical protein
VIQSTGRNGLYQGFRADSRNLICDRDRVDPLLMAY